MSPPNKWYGWIPTLTGNIFLSDPFQDGSIYKSLENYSEKIQLNVLIQLNEYYVLVKDKKFNNNTKRDNGEKATVIYAFNKDRPNNLERLYLFFEDERNTGYILYGHADIITLSKNGLIEFDVHEIITSPDPSFTRELANQIYIDIRDTYHKHTHHGEDDLAGEGLIPICVQKETPEEAICGIIDLFLNKIDLYHENIDPYLHSTKIVITGAVELIRRASGEFLYAQHFCLNMADMLPSGMKEKYIQIFANSIQLMNIFLNEVNAKYAHDTAARSSGQNELSLKQNKIRSHYNATFAGINDSNAIKIDLCNQ